MKLFLLSMIAFSLVSCASHFKELYTMDDKAQPQWADEAKVFTQSENLINIVGFITVDKTRKTNMNSVKKASEIKAWEELTKYVNTTGTSEAELKNETDQDATDMSGKEILSSTTKITSEALMKKARVTDRWYRVVEEELTDGEKVQKVEYFTKLEITKRDLKEVLNQK